MRDPYLYDDVDVLKNRANIKDSDTLRKAEADITNLAMSAIYERDYNKFDIDTCAIFIDLSLGRYLTGLVNLEAFKW